jgi:hypothetical protein
LFFVKFFIHKPSSTFWSYIAADATVTRCCTAGLSLSASIKKSLAAIAIYFISLISFMINIAILNIPEKNISPFAISRTKQTSDKDERFS